MLCPSCGFDNIDGVDECEQCRAPLTQDDYPGDELEQSITRHAISVLSTKIPAVIRAERTVADAIHEMASHGVGCLLIENESGELTGIVSERDILNRVVGAPDKTQAPVSEIMTPAPTSVAETESIAYAMQLMDSGGFRHLPVLDGDGRPRSIISVRDILRFLCIRFGDLRTSSD